MGLMKMKNIILLLQAKTNNTLSFIYIINYPLKYDFHEQ